MATLLRTVEFHDDRPDRARYGRPRPGPCGVPPATIIDKHVYSPWTGSDLHQQLRGAGIDTVIITGGETDVCVLSTSLGAIDWGFRVILVQDVLCSSADETHDAMMNVYMSRFGEQVETVTTETLLESWHGYVSARCP